MSGAIATMAAAVLVAWLVQRADGAGEVGVLRHGSLIKLVAGLSTAMAPLCLYVLLTVDDGGQGASLTLLTVMFALIGPALLATAFRTRGRFDLHGITFESVWGGQRSRPWSDLSSLRMSPLFGWHVLTFRDGTKICIHNMMSGRAALLDLLRGRGFEAD